MNDDPDSPSLNVIVRIEDEAWLHDLPDAHALSSDAALATLTNSPSGCAGNAESIEVSVLLTSDAAVQNLNRDYRGQDRPTNVLAFEADKPEDEATAAGVPLLLGDVVLARETLLREAKAQGKAPADHLRHLVVHGALHLLGFDHQAEAEAERMEAAEIAILAVLGIADPYAPARPTLRAVT